MRTISVAIAVLFGANLGVYAQPAPAPVSATELFRQGKQLMKEGRYVEACAKFENSERLESSIGAQLNLGDCRAKLGQTATARLLFLKAAASSRAAGDSEREAEANRQAALLEARLSYLTVSTTPETRALPTLTVNIDGGVLPLTALDVPLPVDPGEHTVTAAATKYAPWQGKVVIAIGQRTTSLAIPTLVAVAVAAPRPTNPGEAELVAQAVAAHAADVAAHGGAPAVVAAPAVAAAPPVAAAPAAPAVAVAPAVAAVAIDPAAPAVAADPAVSAPGEVAPPAEVAPTTRVSKGLFLSIGGAYLPGGINGPGDATVGITQVGWRIRQKNIELRFSGIAAYESTYYQTSFDVLAAAQFFDYAGEIYSFGAGVGLGVGSYSPIGDYNADNGTTAELMLITTPAAFHLGPGHHIELGLDVGALYLVAFSEVDPFFQLRAGYTF